MPIYSYEELRKVSNDDLINAYDMKAAKVEVGLNYYLDELRRRNAARLEDMTRTIMWLTVYISFLTVLVTVATVATLVITYHHL